jgi:hypothetical protein
VLVLGEFKSYDSRLSIGYPIVDIIDHSDGGIIEKGAVNTVPDQILIQGTLASNAIASYTWRGGSPFPSTPGADWRIVGSLGELHLTSSSWSLNVGRDDTKLQFFDKASGVVEDVEVESDEWDVLPWPARNIARLFEAHRKGEWVPDFKWAVRRHEFLEELWRRFDASQ